MTSCAKTDESSQLLTCPRAHSKGDISSNSRSNMEEEGEEGGIRLSISSTSSSNMGEVVVVVEGMRLRLRDSMEGRDIRGMVRDKDKETGGMDSSISSISSSHRNTSSSHRRTSNPINSSNTSSSHPISSTKSPTTTVPAAVAVAPVAS
jgi:hypothetical protein